MAFVIVHKAAIVAQKVRSVGGLHDMYHGIDIQIHEIRKGSKKKFTIGGGSDIMNVPNAPIIGIMDPDDAIPLADGKLIHRMRDYFDTFRIYDFKEYLARRLDHYFTIGPLCTDEKMLAMFGSFEAFKDICDTSGNPELIVLAELRLNGRRIIHVITFNKVYELILLGVNYYASKKLLPAEAQAVLAPRKRCRVAAANDGTMRFYFD